MSALEATVTATRVPEPGPSARRGQQDMASVGPKQGDGLGGGGSSHGVVFKGGAQGTELGRPVPIDGDLRLKGRMTLGAKLGHQVPLTGKPEQRGGHSRPRLPRGAV